MEWKRFDRGVFLVNILGILYDPKTKRILIGLRKKDPFINRLSWCFPGGRPGYENDLEFYLKREIKAKTGLDAEVKKILFSKTYPEKREFLSIYYLCEVKGGKEKAGESFIELKWVRPEELRTYFTTSLHPKLEELLRNI